MQSYSAFDDDVKSYDSMDLGIGMAGISLSSICADAQREIQISRQMAYLQVNEAMRLLRLHQQQQAPTAQCHSSPPQPQPQKQRVKSRQPRLKRRVTSPALLPWVSSCEHDDESIITYVGGKMVRVPSIRSVSSHLFVDGVDERSIARKSGLKRARSTFETSSSAHLLHPLSRLQLRGLSHGRSIRICDPSTDKRTKRKMHRLMSRKKLARQRSMSCGAMLGAIKEHVEAIKPGLSGSY